MLQGPDTFPQPALERLCTSLRYVTANGSDEGVGTAAALPCAVDRVPAAAVH